MKKNCSVLLAGDGKTKALLQQEFPGLPFLPLKGYDVEYSRKKWWLPFHIAGQIPKIITAIEEENKWLQEVVQQHQVDAVLSDNRYGLYHKDVHSVFITHQLLIKTGLGGWADELLQAENYKHINRFAECWVPDAEGDGNLAGELSHPKKLPDVPLHYVGSLSRFSRREEKSGEKHLLIVLSGPEPQRTMLEELLLEQLQRYHEPVVLVRGLPGSESTVTAPSNVAVYNHTSATVLEALMKDASFVVSRCGYSTIMDLTALKKRSILIPTPGQTEQEYLAQHLMKQNVALCIAQEKFRLANALVLAQQFSYQLMPFETNSSLNAVVDQLLGKLSRSSATA